MKRHIDKSRRTIKKLTLSRETLRVLQWHDIEHVRGGLQYETRAPSVSEGEVGDTVPRESGCIQ